MKPSYKKHRESVIGYVNENMRAMLKIRFQNINYIHFAAAIFEKRSGKNMNRNKPT